MLKLTSIDNMGKFNKGLVELIDASDLTAAEIITVLYIVINGMSQSVSTAALTGRVDYNTGMTIKLEDGSYALGIISSEG